MEILHNRRRGRRRIAAINNNKPTFYMQLTMSNIGTRSATHYYYYYYLVCCAMNICPTGAHKAHSVCFIFRVAFSSDFVFYPVV